MTGDGAHADQQASVTNPDDLLVAAVELVADTVDASAPRAMRKRLLSGLVDDLGMEAAMLWAPLERDEGLALLDNVGLSSELTELLAAWPAESTADRIARSASGADSRWEVGERREVPVDAQCRQRRAQPAGSGPDLPR